MWKISSLPKRSPHWLAVGLCVVLAGSLPTKSQLMPSTAPADHTSDRVPHLLQELRDPENNTILVVAHRMGWKYAPENSIQGLEMCIDMGVDILETDLHITKDGRFVVMHDKTLDRTTTGHGAVADSTLAQIETLQLLDAKGKPTSERVPTLEQLVSLSRGHILIYLDKTEDCIDQVYARLVELDAVNFSMFYGERPEAALRARYGNVLDRITYLPKIYDSTSDLSNYIDNFASVLHPPAFVIEFKTRDSKVLQAIPQMKAAHARVWASPLWPAAVAAHTDDLALKDPDANWGWMISRGVNMFCTDRPRELLAYLRSKNMHE